MKNSLILCFMCFAIALAIYPLLVCFGFYPLNYDRAEELDKAKAVMALTLTAAPGILFLVLAVIGFGSKYGHALIVSLIFFVPFINALLKYRRLRETAE